MICPNCQGYLMKLTVLDGEVTNKDYNFNFKIPVYECMSCGERFGKVKGITKINE